MPDGRWLISFRLTSTVGIVDPATGSFDWKWGAGQLSHQHAATALPNGRVLLFDNGCHRPRLPSFSQLLEVDPATDEVVWSYRPDITLAFFSFMVSGAERLPGGNTFITEVATGRLFEVTLPVGDEGARAPSRVTSAAFRGWGSRNCARPDRAPRRR